LAWRSRATNTAEASETAGCGFEALYQIASRQQPELVDVDVDEAGERRAGQLPAIDAMAMRQRSGRLDLETDPPTETAPPDHDEHLQTRP
jgi:hypothetical protein